MLSMQAAIRHTIRLFLVAWFVFQTAPVFAGEKIIFSTPDRDDTAPLADPKEKQRFKPTGGIDNFRPSATDPGQIPFIPATVPKLARDKKGVKGEEDSSTERREWIFKNIKEVENRGGKSTKKKDSEEPDLDSTEKKDKTAMEEFFESRVDKQKNSGKDGKSSKDADNTTATDPNAAPGLESADSRPPAMRNSDGMDSSARQRNGVARADGDSAKVSAERSELQETFIDSRATASRSERSMERQARAEEFSRMLNPSGTPGTASGGLGSSFNFSGGLSPQSARPLSQSSFDALLGKSPAASLPNSLPGSVGGLKPTALDDFGSRPTAIGAPGPVFTPNVEMIPPPRPAAILEVPKRRQ